MIFQLVAIMDAEILVLRGVPLKYYGLPAAYLPGFRPLLHTNKQTTQVHRKENPLIVTGQKSLSFLAESRK